MTTRHVYSPLQFKFHREKNLIDFFGYPTLLVLLNRFVYDRNANNL